MTAPETVADAPSETASVAPPAALTIAAAPAVPASETVEAATIAPEPSGFLHHFSCLACSTWNWAACAARVLTGLRTLLFFGTTGLLAILSKLDGQSELPDLISRMIGGKVSTSDIVLFMSISGIVLRWLTTTAVFTRWRTAAKSDTISGVDEPEEDAPSNKESIS